MIRIILTATVSLIISGCAAGFQLSPKEKFSLEQRAITNAISLCKKFGHKENTVDFTRCAEQRYDEYMVHNE